MSVEDKFLSVNIIGLALGFFKSESKVERRLKNRIGYNYDMSRTAIESGRLLYR